MPLDGFFQDFLHLDAKETSASLALVGLGVTIFWMRCQFHLWGNGLATLESVMAPTETQSPLTCKKRQDTQLSHDPIMHELSTVNWAAK
jgi:hypothetical protein